MLKMNKLMKEILETEEDKKCYLQIDVIVNEILSRTKIIKNCIIYDEEGDLVKENINFNNIIRFFGDWTGYEVSCNELRFERQGGFSSQMLVFVSKLSYMLSQKYNGKKFVIYISLCDDEIELRFHTYRKDEPLWLDEDLDKYDRPILYFI